MNDSFFTCRSKGVNRSKNRDSQQRCMPDLHLLSCHAAGGRNMTRTGDQRTRLRQTTSCHRIGLSYSTRLWTLENTASRCVTIPALDTGTVHFYPSVPTDPDFASCPPESELNGRTPLLDDRSVLLRTPLRACALKPRGAENR